MYHKLNIKFSYQLVMCHFMFLADIEAPRWVLMGLVVKLAHSVRFQVSSSSESLTAYGLLSRSDYVSLVGIHTLNSHLLLPAQIETVGGGTSMMGRRSGGAAFCMSVTCTIPGRYSHLDLARCERISVLT